MARPYKSTLRDERASRTRAALLDACEALLLERPVEEVTLPAVAQRAGVTKPTAYSYFPDNDALMDGFLTHIRDRIGMAHATLAGIAPDDLPRAVRANYRRFEQNAQLLRRVMDSPSYDRVRLARKVDRPALVLPVWDCLASERVLRERLGSVYLLLAPRSWRWLRDTWGLDAAAAARAAMWAMQALVSALDARAEPIQSKPMKTRSKTRKSKE